MGNYANIKSKFIKEKIKNLSWKNRKYIDELIDMEKFLGGAKFGLSTPYKIRMWETEFKKEWKAIQQELCPGRYEANKKAEKSEKEQAQKEIEKLLEEEEMERIADKRDWVNAGGKI